jgi:hypothetical protein
VIRQQLVVLRGAVPSYYLKQVAQETALHVPGIRRLRNELKVDAPHRAHFLPQPWKLSALQSMVDSH